MNLVFDLEADGARDEATRVWCVVAKDMATGEVHQFGPDEIQQALLLLGKATLLIGHNIINYDIPLLERLYGFKFSGLLQDTVILSRLYMSDRPRVAGTSTGPHSLESWGFRLGRAKVEHSDWSAYSGDMLHRCTEDVQITHLLVAALEVERRVTGIDWTEATDLEQDIARIMTQQEIFGVPFDVDAAKDLLAVLQADIDDIDQTVVPLLPAVALPKSRQPTWPSVQFKKDGTPTVAARKYYGDSFSTYRTDIIVKTEPINLGSEQQVKNYLLSIGWSPTEWNYKKGSDGKPLRNEYGDKVKTSPKLTLDSLESCSWPPGFELFGEKVVRRLMLAHRVGMLTGFLRDVRPDGRIPAETVPLGTPTGRMTHRKVVNVPSHSPLSKEIRGLFGTIPGYTRVGVDLRSCQLAGLCHYMGDEEFQKQVLEGDVHQYAAQLATLETRQQGKKLVYLTLFGGGPPKLATDLSMSVDQARMVQKTFFSNLPKLKELLDRLSREWKEKGYLVGLDGRAVWVRAEHMLLVYLMQNLESTVMKYFLRDIDNARCSLDYKQVTVNHDEGQFLVKDDHVEGFEFVAQSAIVATNNHFKLRCPQSIDIKVGRTWAECH